MPRLPRLSERQFALGALTVFAVWIFMVLPFVFLHNQHWTTHDEKKPENISPSVIPYKLFTVSGRDEIAAYCATDSDTQTQEWTHKYICDIKITDFWIAFFTCMLTLATFGLACVGYLQVKISRLQYRATAALEVPLLVVSAIKLVEYANQTATTPITDPIQNGMIPNFCRVLPLVINSGRTSARMRHVCLEWVVAANLPGYPNYQHVQVWDASLDQNDQKWLRIDPLGDIDLSPTQRGSIQSQLTHLWVYGYISYFDRTGKMFTRGFVVRWDLSQGFVPEPLPEYSYHR
jgi:hypothetical protein